MKIEKRLEELGLKLPEVEPPLFSYIPASVWQDMVFISGQVPRVDGDIPYKGKVPGQVSVEQARECARICTLQALAWMKETLGSLDQIEKVIKLTGYVNSSPGFVGQPSVIDACSELLVEIFGEAGRHARAAVGMAELPGGTPVEIEFIFGVRK
jgi:enamine deaminase RidA (YjgF/YER057c/UK114 family)